MRLVLFVLPCLLNNGPLCFSAASRTTDDEVFSQAFDDECEVDVSGESNCSLNALQRRATRLTLASGSNDEVIATSDGNKSACVASYSHNCKNNPVCCDPSTKCYEKDSHVAVCLNSCQPGIHSNDEPRWRTPWSCRVLGSDAGGSAGHGSGSPPATVPHHNPGQCTKSYTHNCMHNPVCCDADAKCYSKDRAVAVCLKGCSPGIHHNDPPQYQTPWSCDVVGSGGGGGSRPAPAPAPTSAPAPAPVAILDRPSSGKLLTFYMYRAQNDQNFVLENVNAANLEGAMWYLQNEVVSGVYGAGMKFGITRIRRIKIQMKATQPLLDEGMNFGVRVAFDSGQCTGPNCDFDWKKYGFNVGCNNLGDFPFPKYDTHYDGGIWYSLPGPCPSKTYLDKPAACRASEPGGRCASPSGSGDCTWSYEDAGEIGLEPLYAGYSGYHEFWANPNDSAANAKKVSVARALFAEKYGDDPPVPACDFNFDQFYR